MQRAKTFFLVCAGMFLLALAYHLGASTATAQSGDRTIVGFDLAGPTVITSNGDIYYGDSNNINPPVYWGNIWVGGGGPIPTEKGTWGQLKVRYR